MLRDVSRIATLTNILGEEISYPVCVSPTGMQCMARHEGELATARGMLTQVQCTQYGSCVVLTLKCHSHPQHVLRPVHAWY